MDKQAELSKKLEAITKSMAEFSELALQAGEDTENKDPFGRIAAIIGSARKARKVADAFMDYAETLEDVFNL